MSYVELSWSDSIAASLILSLELKRQLRSPLLDIIIAVDGKSNQLCANGPAPRIPMRSRILDRYLPVLRLLSADTYMGCICKVIHNCIALRSTSYLRKILLRIQLKDQSGLLADRLVDSPHVERKGGQQNI
jgi:hypothetical protein